MKKSFKNNNPAMAFITHGKDEIVEDSAQTVHNAQDVQHVQGVQHEHNVQDVQHVQDVQRAPRVQKASKFNTNIAFTSENHEYLSIMARLEGISVTAYINKIVSEEKTRKRDLYESIKSILNSTKGE